MLSKEFLLNSVLCLSFLSSLGILLVPAKQEKAIRYFTLGAQLLILLLFVSLMLSTTGPVHWNKIVWSAAGLHFHLALDPVNEYLLLLTVILYPLVTWASFNSIREKIKLFHLMLLLSQTFVLGTFLMQNLLFFYVFWEFSTIPLFLIIGIWGGDRRIYATFKFLLFTALGTILMLGAILYLSILYYRATNHVSFELTDLLTLASKGQFPPGTQVLAFCAFLLAFIIKIPMPPFHTWLPDAHVEAPTPGSMILAGILLKMGVYGFIKFAMALFPEALESGRLFLVALAAGGALYGSFLAWVQQDIKKIIAYSSIGHMGLLMVGVLVATEVSMSGAMVHAFGHGLSSAGLFFAVGVLYERYHRRGLADYQGLARLMPRYAVCIFLLTLSAIGFPGTIGFTAESLILAGSFQYSIGQWYERPLYFFFSLVALAGVLLSALYMLRLVGKILWGELQVPGTPKNDLVGRETIIFSILIFFILLFGLFPKAMLETCRQIVQDL
jgi:NADH-quinone oxidoreductase subunit M